MKHTATFRSLASGETVLFHRHSGEILPYAADYSRRGSRNTTAHIELHWEAGRLVSYSGLAPLSAYPLLVSALEASGFELPPEVVA